MGRVFRIGSNQITGEGGEWYYDDGSGVARRFFRSNDNENSDEYYTLDTSSIKADADYDSDNHLAGWILWMPDGTRHEFYQVVDYADDYYLTRILSPVATNPPTEVVLEYNDPTLRKCISSIHDSHGRDIYITCSDQHPNGTALEGVVLAVDVPAFGNQRAVYSFEYIKPTFYYPESTAAQNPHHLLTALQLNDSQHRIEFGYGSPITGNIRSITLPTGGRIEYDYSLFELNHSSNPSANEIEIHSVTTRRVVSNTTDTWQYERSRYDDAEVEHGGVVKTSILDPFGNTTEYFFISRLAEGQGDPEALEGSLERVDFYHGPGNPANLKRSVSYQHEWDPAPNGTGLIAVNTRVNDVETTYVDDGGKVSRTHFWSWDGHNWGRREDFGFNEQSYRCYRTTYHEFSEAWIVSAPESIMVQDGGCQSVDDVVSWTEFEYEEDGRISEQQEHLFTPDGYQSVQLHPHDSVVTEFEYDPSTGVLARTTKSSTVPNTPAYEVDYTFQWGYPASTKFVGMNWKTADSDIDRNTGLSSVVRDSAGYATSYTYDALGRLTSIVPPAPEIPWTLTYPNPNEVLAEHGTSGTANYMLQRTVLDSLGREVRVETLSETGATVYRKKAYVGSTSLVSFESVWAPSSDSNPAGTSFQYTLPTAAAPSALVQDPFGRVQKITPPDGKVREFSYVGVDRTVTVKDINNAGLSALTVEHGDAFGRTVEVVPPNIGAKANYVFDVLDRLVRVELTDQLTSLPVQARVWEYDTLSRLKEKSEPESGTTTYTKFDALGNPLEVVLEDGRTHKYTYDAAGRVTREETKRNFPGSDFRLLKETAYQNTPTGSHGVGALSNIITLKSYDEVGPSLVETQDLYYDGLNGRMNKVSQKFPFWLDSAGLQALIETNYEYYDTGQLYKVTYPHDVTSSRVPTKVVYHYNHGLLTQVSSNRHSPNTNVMEYLVTGISYDSSGAPASITLSNGVQETLDRDLMSRPKRIKFKKGASTLFDSGLYAYDGASNLVSVGSDAYAYDLIGRLQSATIMSPVGPPTSYSQTYAYDAFGNMKSRTNAAGQAGLQTFQVDPTTNRLGGISVAGVTLPYIHSSNGSVIADGLFTYTYDNAERVKSLQTSEATPQTIETYDYDVSDYRIRVASGDLARQSVFLRSSEGKVLSEYARPSSVIQPQWKNDYVYALGRHIAVVENIEPNTSTGIVTSASTFMTNCGGGASNCAKLSWQAVTGSDIFGYDVYRAPASAPNSYSRITSSPVQGLSYVDTQVGASSTYFYKLVTVDTAGVESTSTSARKIKIGDPYPPTIPDNLIGEAVTCSLVSLTWSAATDSDNDVIGYNVYRRVEGTPTWPPTPRNGSVPINTTSFADSLAPLRGGGPFEYKVEALDAAGWSNSSMTTVVMPPLEECGGGGAFMRWPEESEFFYSTYRAIGQSPPDTSFRLRFVHVDHLGTPRLVTSQSGTVVATMKLFPFGEEVPGSSSTGLGHRFTGHERDTGSLHDYMLARTYQFNSARFSQVDPVLRALSSDPQTWNRYSYARNKPMEYADPTGTSFLGKLFSGRLFGGGWAGEGVEFRVTPEPLPYLPFIGIATPVIGIVDYLYDACFGRAGCEVVTVTATDPRTEERHRRKVADRIKNHFLRLQQEREIEDFENLLVEFFAGYNDPCGDMVPSCGVVFPIFGFRGPVRGFTTHGVNQAITRGMTPAEILNTVRNPARIVPQSQGVVKYIGEHGFVVLDSGGRVITVVRYKAPSAP